MSNSHIQHTHQFGSNISRYYIYTALKGFGFGLISAIWVIFLTQHRGLTLVQASLVDVTFFVATAFGEVPTGIVADRFGRKMSMTIGSAMMCVGILGWTFAPNLPLIMLSYLGMGLGYTFLSGAEDALLYESMQLSGRADGYTAAAGRAGAVFLGFLAVGSVISGLLGSVNLILPMIVCGLSLIAMLIAVLTLRETQSEVHADGQPRKTFGTILGQSFALMHAQPTLLYPIIYLALVPIAAFSTETLLLQPQALKLGVPIAGIGVLVMIVQLTNMMASNLSNKIKARVGEARLLYTVPLFIVASLILLAVFQVLLALVSIAVIGFITAVLRPILLGRIQNEVTDDVRATIISMQSLMTTVIAAISQVSLGFIADQSGFPAAYIGLAGCLAILILFLFWKGHQYLLQSQVATAD